MQSGCGKIQISGVILSADGTRRSPLILTSVAGWRRRLPWWLNFLPKDLSHSTAARNALADEVTDRMDVGSANASGSIRIYTANYQTMLAQIFMGLPAFGNAVNGVAPGAALPWSDTAAAGDGIPAVFDIVNRDETPVCFGDIATAGADLTFPFLEINVNDTVKILNASYTAPP